jgi:hypothetical protein
MAVKTERITILLRPPMRVDVLIRLMRAINREFPGSRLPFDDPEGNLVIELNAELEPDPPG